MVNTAANAFSNPGPIDAAASNPAAIPESVGGDTPVSDALNTLPFVAPHLCSSQTNGSAGGLNGDGAEPAEELAGDGSVTAFSYLPSVLQGTDRFPLGHRKSRWTVCRQRRRRLPHRVRECDGQPGRPDHLRERKPPFPTPYLGSLAHEERLSDSPDHRALQGTGKLSKRSRAILWLTSVRSQNVPPNFSLTVSPPSFSPRWLHLTDEPIVQG
jgi:hypothetical protein